MRAHDAASGGDGLRLLCKPVLSAEQRLQKQRLHAELHRIVQRSHAPLFRPPPPQSQVAGKTGQHIDADQLQGVSSRADPVGLALTLIEKSRVEQEASSTAPPACISIGRTKLFPSSRTSASASAEGESDFFIVSLLVRHH